MESIAKSKGVLAFSAIVLLGIFVFNSFIADDSALTIPPAEGVGADLLKVAENISKATLSSDIFSARSYRLLFDFSIPLRDEPIGRPNPFAPIGQE